MSTVVSKEFSLNTPTNIFKKHEAAYGGGLAD
jgi:hypothetical protein